MSRMGVAAVKAEVALPHELIALSSFALYRHLRRGEIRLNLAPGERYKTIGI